MNVQALRAAEARLRKLESANPISLVCGSVCYYETPAELDASRRKVAARQVSLQTTSGSVFFVAYLPRRGSSGRALARPIDSEGGWLAQRGLMQVHQ